jgi:hypothetical protein
MVSGQRIRYMEASESRYMEASESRFSLYICTHTLPSSMLSCMGQANHALHMEASESREFLQRITLSCMGQANHALHMEASEYRCTVQSEYRCTVQSEYRCLKRVSLHCSKRVSLHCSKRVSLQCSKRVSLHSEFATHNLLQWISVRLHACTFFQSTVSPSQHLHHNIIKCNPRECLGAWGFA